MELPIGHQKSKQEFWIEHIKAAESFEGTLKAYCDLHGLKMGSMSSYRTKLGYSRSKKKGIKKKPSEFVPIKVSPAGGPSRKPEKNLPDPVWLAQFLKAWVGQ